MCTLPWFYIFLYIENIVVAPFFGVLMEERDNIFTALAKAQANFKPAPKNGYNPHFKSNFSTFEDLVAASREELTREGLSVTQYLDYDSQVDATFLVTKLQHSSGEVIPSHVRIYLKDPTDVQKLGSVMSYLKRYSYAAICGIATSENDDDGNAVATEKPVDRASESQIDFIRNLLKSTPERMAKICNHYGIESIEHLSRFYASEVIKMLQTKPKE